VLSGDVTLVFVGAYAITWHPSSVSRACFITAGAIDPKLCTFVPLGKSNSQTKFWSSLILGLAKTENTKSAMTPKLMAGSSWRSNFKMAPLLARFVTI
jgi:hypothetical protein